jgi:signal transduction histidine kinase
MGEAARAWAQGDFSSLIADPGRDELSTLAGDLDRMAADLTALVSARAQLATLEERQRLARDLHDTVKQKVFALSLQLAAAREGAADPSRAQQRLAEAASLVEEIQRELADQLRELQQSAGERDDLVPPLQQRLADFSRRSGCSVRSQLPRQLELTPVQADTVLRIVDEALANIWRHAQATQVDVVLDTHEAVVRLSLCDNGRGGARDTPDGMGLDNMRHRTATLDAGQLEIETLASGGTRLQLRFKPAAASDDD